MVEGEGSSSRMFAAFVDEGGRSCSYDLDRRIEKTFSKGERQEELLMRGSRRRMWYE